MSAAAFGCSPDSKTATACRLPGSLSEQVAHSRIVALVRLHQCPGHPQRMAGLPLHLRRTLSNACFQLCNRDDDVRRHLYGDSDGPRAHACRWQLWAVLTRHRLCAAETCGAAGRGMRGACSDRVPRRNHLRASSGSPISAASRPTDWYRYGLGFCLVLRMPCRRQDATLAGGRSDPRADPLTQQQRAQGRPAIGEAERHSLGREPLTVEEGLVVLSEQISGPDVSWQYSRVRCGQDQQNMEQMLEIFEGAPSSKCREPAQCCRCASPADPSRAKLRHAQSLPPWKRQTICGPSSHSPSSPPDGPRTPTGRHSCPLQTNSSTE